MKERKKIKKLDAITKGRLVNYIERLCPNKVSPLNDGDIAKGFNKEFGTHIESYSVSYMRNQLKIKPKRGHNNSNQSDDSIQILKRILDELRMIRERFVR